MNTCSRFLLAVALIAAVGCGQKSASADKPAASADKPAASASEPAASTPGARKIPPVDINPAKAPPDTWMAFSATDYGFELRFPAAPKKDDNSVPTLVGTIPAATWMVEQDGGAVGITVMTVPESMLVKFNVEGALDGGRDGMINNVGGTIVSEKQTDFAGQATRAIVANVPNPGGGEFQLEARLFWVSPRMYQLIALYPSTSNRAMAQKFFDSFALSSG